MRKKVLLSLALGCLVSIIAFYFAFRRVPFEALIRYFGDIDYIWLLPATGIFVLSFILRVFRWQVILNAAYPIGFWPSFHPLMIGFMMNCVLPARVGEMARPVLLKNRSGVPFAAGLATVAVERAFDVFLLVLLFAGVTASVHIDPDLEIVFSGYQLNRKILVDIGRGMVILAVGMAAVMVLISIERTRRIFTGLISAVPEYDIVRRCSHTLQNSVSRAADFLVRALNHAAEGLSLLNSFARMAGVLALSGAIWGVQIFSLYVLAAGCPGIDLTYLEMAAVMIIICLFIALPSVPGFWGLWEAGGVFALSLFGVSEDRAAGFTLLNHAVTMFPVILMGLGSTIATGVNILQVSQKASKEKS